MTFIGIHLYQFVVVALSATMMVQGIYKYVTRQAGQSLLKVAVRLIVWGGMAAVALFPTLTNSLAKIIGLEGNINAVILTGFLLVFLMIFKILSVVERIEQDISYLTREEAMSHLNKRKDRRRRNS